MQKIALFGKRGNGQFVMVDDQDYEKVSNHKWYLAKNGYVHTTYKLDGKQIHLLIHRLILNLLHVDKRLVDHKNHNKQDNTRDNIRICTNVQNQRNRMCQNGKTSHYKGVTFQYKSWRSQIESEGIIYKLGSYHNEIDAALAYDQKARELFGEYACLNFPDINDYSKLIKTTNRYSSQYKGIWYIKNMSKWGAQCTLNGKTKYIGSYPTEEQAYLAREKFINDMQ